MRSSAKLAPAKVETKPKKAAGKDKSSDKKSNKRGKKGTTGKQAEVANQETKRRAQPLMKEKKPSLINTTPYPISGLCPFLYNPDNYFYQLFCKRVF